MDIGLVIIVAAFLAYLARMLRQPLLVAYVLAGILIGPVFGIITDTAEIQQLAEFGIAFLLFTIGLEIDFKRLRAAGTSTVVGAFLQMGTSFALGLVIAVFLGIDALTGIYIGMFLAFSSTMIVAKLLVDRNEIKTLHGRIMMGVLLIQDVIVIIMMPILANIDTMISMEFFAITLIKGLGLFSIALVLNKYALKKVFDYAARSNEMLFITAIAVCFSFIGLAYYLDFSIAIGAFIGGLALSQFPYTLEIFGEMHSLRDFFSVIFFASLGMIITADIFVPAYMPLFTILLLVTVLIKPIILAVIYLILGYGGRTASVIGLGMGQASEFSFILATQAVANGHLTQGMLTVMVSVVVISMMLTPYLMKARNGIYSLFCRPKIRFFRSVGSPHHIKKLEKHPGKELKNHIVLFGADVMGGKIVDYLLEKKKPFIVAEHNPEVIKELGERGVFTMYGDADNEALLRESGLYRAKLGIVTIPDVEIAGFLIGKAKRFNPKIKLYARAHSEDEAEALYRAGADFVVVPDFVSGGTLVRKIEHFLSGGRKGNHIFKYLGGKR